MRLLIDAGNTRIKWAWLDGGSWTHLPAVPIVQAHTLDLHIATFPVMREVWVSNVAGEKIAQHIQAACATRGWQVRFIQAQSAQCGVQNRYTTPEQLGSDRWAALIAAWHRFGSAALMVNCGTATTIDALSEAGEFIGGLILPGIAMMQNSLHLNTAQLQSSARPCEGKYAELPLSTADGICSGALQATCGAIERQYALLHDRQAPVILSGGAAHAVHELLKLPVIPVKDMVLQGLKIIAQEVSAE
ncbi:MAG: type III pantothenate kinase [Gallionella sp.]